MLQHTKYLISLFILVIFLFPVQLKSQTQGHTIRSSAYSLFSSGNELPFWFTSNQQGIFEHENKTFTAGDLSVSKNFYSRKKWDYSYGGRIIYAQGDSAYYQFNEWYTGFRYGSFYLKAGCFPEETIWGGLSSTNGNIDWSNNARPMPRIRIATDDYISLPFGEKSQFWKNVSFKAIYEEGFLNDDNRYVQNAHLHHKAFFLRKQISIKEHVTIGGEHYAMWGGISPDFGKLPGFKSYLRYVFALPGSKDAPIGDQEYFSGNHLGLFYLDYEKSYKTGTFTMYLNHPWDHVPAIVHNLFDNLIGLNFQLNKKSFISDILLEMLNTNDQGRVMHVRDDRDPTAYYEGYYEHGEYLSGFSYENRIIAAPFFTPMVIKDGINYGTGNNRVSALHFALKGYFLQNFSWKYFFTYWRSSGTYGGQAYDSIIPGYFDMTRHKFSQLLELNYEMPKIGMNLSIAGASDNGHWDNLYAFRFKLEKTFSIK